MQYQDQVQLCDGPALSEGGFFYDFMLKGKSVSESDFVNLEALCKKIIKKKQRFERLQVSRDFVRQMFGYSDLKLQVASLDA